MSRGFPQIPAPMTGLRDETEGWKVFHETSPDGRGWASGQSLDGQEESSVSRPLNPGEYPTSDSTPDLRTNPGSEVPSRSFTWGR